MVDAAGVIVACANESLHAACVPPTVRFEIKGEGEIAAVGSADPLDPSSFRRVDASGGMLRKTYRGRATAIVRPGKPPTQDGGAAMAGGRIPSGPLTLTATAAGLKGASVTIQVGS